MLRTVRAEEQFTRQIAALRVNYQRLDEALESVVDVLAKRPDLFPRAPGTPLSILRLVGYRGVPALNVYFIFDESYVYLLYADQVTPDELA